jgi:tetratricopeptide (TPR) repeat protein
VAAGSSAAALLEELQTAPGIPDTDRYLFLAEGYSLLKREEEAGRCYRQAAAAGSDRAEVQLAAARYFFTRDHGQAQHYLQQVLRLAPSNGSARRMLASLLAGRVETDQDLREVWRLLQGSGADAVDQRMQAIHLLQRGGSEQRARAQRLLESLVADPKNKATLDHLLLARLYEAQGQTRAAREQLQALVQRDNPGPDHLAIYVDHLLKASRLQQAEEHLNRLASLEPEVTSLRTLQLRARLLKAQQREAEIVPLFDSHLQKNLPKQAETREQAQRLLTLARTLSDSDLHQAAETYYRRAVEADPAAASLYCLWLTERGRAAEALQMCLQSAASGPSDAVAVTIAQVLTLGKLSREQRESAEPVLNLAVKQHGKNLTLLFSVASLRIIEGKNEEAVELLRKAYAINPRSLVVLNNLALGLSMTPGGQKEALQHIDRAIAIAGEDPELLDSKGWILLQQRKAAEAEALFREAISLPPGDPRHHFHLALACQAQGKDREAREAYERARQGNLAESLLSPQERSQLAMLEQSHR